MNKYAVFTLAVIAGLFVSNVAAVNTELKNVGSVAVDLHNGERDLSNALRITITPQGKAVVADEATNAKLKVSFFGPLYTGDYWILDHADDYAWSIVGEPSGRYLWLLSREPVPPSAMAQAIMKRVEELGYDRWALRITRQG